jgi:hypothetical protein
MLVAGERMAGAEKQAEMFIHVATAAEVVGGIAMVASRVLTLSI